MATKVCEVCGKTFESSKPVKVCEPCHHQKCCICGKEMYLKGEALHRFKTRGWITCGQKCAKRKASQTLMEEHGVANAAQLPSAREKIRQTRLNESEETKRVRSNNIRIGKGAEGERLTVNKPKAHGTNQSKNKAKKVCAKCHREFGGHTSRLLCDECRHTTCPVCGKPIEVTGNLVHKYLKRGWVTCGDPNCQQVGKNITFRDRYGKDFPWETDTSERIAAYVAENPNASIGMVAEALGMTYQTVQHANLRDGLGVKTVESYKEQLIASYLDGLGVNYIRNTRSVIQAPDGSKLELDFYLPDHNIAIEVNDFLTHSTTYSPYGTPKPHGYHYMKTKLCEEKGIRLIHAWEHCLPCWEGQSKRLGSWSVLQNVIEHACGLTPHRYYARQMKVVEFPAKDTKKFFEENNVNGYRTATTTYALVPKSVEDPTPDEIIMAYAVGHNYFGKGRYDAEIARGACKLHHMVVGGASKLWHHIIENTDYQSVVYYVDVNYYDASSMSFLDGVEYLGHADSFWNYWVETNELKNREPKRHKEIMQGYKNGTVWKIENAGTETYVWHRQ